MNQKENISKILKKIYKFIRSHGHKIKFKRLSNGVYGWYYVETEEVEIDFRKDILSTLFHECAHALYPDYSETKIYKLEKYIINNISEVQVRNIIKLLGKYL